MPAASGATAGLAPILAHFGHWYFQLLYAVPVTVIVGALSIQSWREGRARRVQERAGGSAGERAGGSAGERAGGSAGERAGERAPDDAEPPG